MAIRQVGGVPVYTIDVDVPKVTDARGKSYGTLVSDLRWKLWEEVQNSQLQQMKFEQMSRQSQLDVLEQRQRDISRAIRDARELQAKVKAGTVSPYQAAQLQMQQARLQTGSQTIKEEPARDPFTGELIPNQTVTTITTKTPISPRGGFPQIKQPDTADIAISQEFEEKQADVQRQQLEEYINELTAEQTRARQEFATAASQALPQDLLSRTRGAFQSQIGEGGFGIRRRPLRQLPRFDEAAVGTVSDTMRRLELEAIGAAEQTKGDVLTPEEERAAVTGAREAMVSGLEGAGATPTSRAGFLMKPPPPYEGQLPRETTDVPTGRFRDDFSVETSMPPVSRQAQVEDELRIATRQFAASPQGSAEEAKIVQNIYGLEQELEDIKARDAATLDYNRAAEYDFLGEPRPRRAQDRREMRRMERAAGASQTPPAAPMGDTISPQGDFTLGGSVITPQQATLPPDLETESMDVEETEAPTTTIPTRGLEVDMEGLPEAKAKPTIQSRRDLYALKTIKKGMELAEKPKQLARLQKTDNPKAAPDWVRLVNSVYELNATKPNKFKLTFDEIAKVYKNDTKTREKAHSYLVALDATESNVTKPV